MRILVLGLASVALAVAAACGGSVVFVEDGDGGSGGSTTTTTTTKASATSSKASNATATSTTSSVSVTTSSVSVTTGTGGLFCEIGESPADCQTCVDDAISGPCSQALQDCFGDPACENYGTCVFECNSNTGCCQSCATQFPQEAVAAYHTLLSCVFCSVCGGPQCAGVVPGFCSE